MKNIMIIDGAINCAYDIFVVPDDVFLRIFPGAGQNIEFIEDIENDGRFDSLKVDFKKMWSNPVKKEHVHGIHGILFFQLENKKIFYPSKKDEDLDLTGRAFSTNDL